MLTFSDCHCEDRPCCGCGVASTPESEADARYDREVAWMEDDRWYEDDDEGDDEAAWMTEDGAMEDALFGEC